MDPPETAPITVNSEEVEEAIKSFRPGSLRRQGFEGMGGELQPWLPSPGLSTPWQGKASS